MLVREVQDPISSPLYRARPPSAVERLETAEVQAAARKQRGRGGGGREAAWKRRRRAGGGVGCYLWLSSCMSGVESS